MKKLLQRKNYFSRKPLQEVLINDLDSNTPVRNCNFIIYIGRIINFFYSFFVSNIYGDVSVDNYWNSIQT